MLLVCDLHPTERPRGRLLRLGAAALTVPELLAILLGAATERDAATGVGCELFASCGGSLRRMASASLGALTTVRSHIIAVLEDCFTRDHVVRTILKLRVSNNGNGICRFSGRSVRY
jgi:DNA repair protein RadC